VVREGGKEKVIKNPSLPKRELNVNIEGGSIRKTKRVLFNPRRRGEKDQPSPLRTT